MSRFVIAPSRAFGTLSAAFALALVPASRDCAPASDSTRRADDLCFRILSCDGAQVRFEIFEGHRGQLLALVGCVMVAPPGRRRNLHDSFGSGRRFFRRKGGGDFLKARIAPEWIPEGQ